MDPGPSRLRGGVKMVKSGRLGAPVCEAHGHEAAGRMRLRAALGRAGRGVSRRSLEAGHGPAHSARGLTSLNAGP